MQAALGFLDLKHHTTTVFNYDLAHLAASFIGSHAKAGTEADLEPAGQALVEAHEQRLELGQLHAAGQGLPESSFVIPFEIGEESPVRGGLVCHVEPERMTAESQRDYQQDALVLIDNWCIAFSALLTPDQQPPPSLESLPGSIADLARELNACLGDARGTTTKLTEAVAAWLRDSGNAKPDDLKEACQLLTRDLDRAKQLIKALPTAVPQPQIRSQGSRPGLR